MSKTPMRKSSHRQSVSQLLGAGAFLLSGFLCSAEGTNSLSPLLSSPSLPDAGPSMLRVVGALCLVLAIFLGGVWMYRNWQRVGVRRGQGPKLNILEVRSLGGRQALYVVGYEQERFLLAATPAGVNLVSHLPSVVAEDVAAEPKLTPVLSFPQALAQVLKRK
jgi:flagellar biogenesis protein FliO